MIKFTVQTEIARSPAEVFAYATDPSKLATWQTNTISAAAEDDQPIGLGSRVREVHRVPGGKQLASLIEVSEYEPDQLFALRMLEGALPIHARITFEPIEKGTRVQFTALNDAEREDRLRRAMAAAPRYGMEILPPRAP